MILVTGASGFVGTALLGVLAERGLPYRAASRNRRPGFAATGTFDGKTDWTDVLHGVTEVIHLAGRVHVVADQSVDPLAAYRAINVDATLNLAQQAANAGVKRFVFASSIKVNGEATQPGRPFDEETPPAPVDPYGISKLEAELALFELARVTGLEIVVVRPPLVYGPGVKANFALLLRWVERGWPLPLGAVQNRRSLIYVRNLSDLLILCTWHPAAAGQVFLASDGPPISTPDLIRMLAFSLGRPARLVSIPPHRFFDLVLRSVGGPSVLQRLTGSLEVRIDKANSYLGWHPPYTIEQGLQALVETTRTS